MTSTRTSAFLLLTLMACAEPPRSPMAPADLASLAKAPTSTAWSPATPISELNTPTATEGCPYVTRSGHTLFFASNRPGGYGALDLYMSRWDAAAKQWGPAINLGPTINTAANEQCPLLLQNGKELLFVSNRPGGAGGLDLWIARAHDQRRDHGWEAPENLTALNTSADEFGPGYYEDHGRTVLYFNSNRPGGSGGHDLYSSTQSHHGSFSAPEPVAGLNTPFQEQFAALTKHGLEIFFASDRPGTLGGLDLWSATRERTSDAWSTPVNLGPAVNSAAADGRSTISWDGTTLIFNSNRAGSVDLYQTTRERTRHQQ